MSQCEQFIELRSRAEDFLKKHPRTEQEHSNINTYQLIKELTVQQVELDLQNDDLRRKQAELQEISEKYIELFNLAPTGYFMLDNNGLIIQVNQSGANLLGVDEHILRKKSFSRYISPDFQAVFSQYKQVISGHIPVKPCEVKLFRRNQSLFHAQVEGKCIVNAKTNENEFLIMVTDVSNRKVVEEWHHQQQKKMASIDRVSSIGELNAAMAHELNHPLAVISNYIHGCIKRLESGEPQKNILIQTMQKAANQLHRVSEIILRMRNYACKGNIKYEPTNIDALIKETLPLIQYEIGEESIPINYRPTAASLPLIMLDSIHIQQVIMNLARNAIESMKDSQTSHPKLTIEVNQTSRDAIEIHVIDNGPGYSLSDSHKLFEPNFTTKPYGVGLGLAVSHSIIESHGGKLSAELNATYGACFKIKLPINSIE